MNLLPSSQTLRARKGLEDRRQCEVRKANPTHDHRAKRQNSIVQAGIADEAGYEGVPRNDVSVGHFVEYPEGVEEATALRVEVEEGGEGDGGGERGEGPGHEGVDLWAQGGEVEGGAGREDGREGVGIEGEGVGPEAEEEAEGGGRVAGADVGGEEGVVLRRGEVGQWECREEGSKGISEGRVGAGRQGV